MLPTLGKDLLLYRTLPYYQTPLLVGMFLGR